MTTFLLYNMLLQQYWVLEYELMRFYCKQMTRKHDVPDFMIMLGFLLLLKEEKLYFSSS